MCLGIFWAFVYGNGLCVKAYKGYTGFAASF